MELNITTATLMAGSTVVDEYLAVKVDGTQTSATGQFVYGIVRTAAKQANSSMEVVTGGECYATAAATTTAGQPLTGAANGRLTPATIGTHDVCAHALEAASAGEVFRVILR